MLLAVAGSGLGACGGDDEDVQRLLDKAFRQPIDSADVKIDATLEARGLKSLDKPVRIQASGPYRQNKDKLPSFDIDLKVGAGGGGQVISTGRVSTGDRAFVKFEDTYYELPRSDVERANRSIRGSEQQRSLLKNIGPNARSWVQDAKEQGEEEVGGADTTRVSGRLDVERVLPDLNRFVRESGKALGAAAGRVPKPLSRSDLAKVAEVVRDPTFDIYVGKDDDTIRRLSARLQVDVPEKDRASVGGLEGGSVEFSIEFAHVNGDQQIEAPAKARPLSDLTKSLGTGGLGGAIGGDGTTPGDTGGGGTTTTPDAEAFKRYAECLDKANPEDTRALQRCSKLLQ